MKILYAIALGLIAGPVHTEARAQATWSPLAAEGKPFTIARPSTVRLGVDWAGVWTNKVLQPGTYTCAISTFGADPKPGSGKVCQVSSTAPGTLSPYPACWPKQAGSTGSAYKRGMVDGVQWVGWTCTVSGKQKLEGFVYRLGFEMFEPATVTTTAPSTLKALWTENVRDGDVTMNPAREAMRAAFPGAVR